MKNKLSIVVLVGTLFAGPVFAGEQTVTFDVSGMYCASCPFIVESAMGAVEGVLSVDADSDTRTAVVVFEDTATNVGLIAQASVDVGYDASIIQDKS